MITIIAKNTTDSDIYITDLAGQYIGANSQIILTDYYTLTEIGLSNTLKTFISDEDIIINDGTSDLSVAAGLLHVASITNYESKKTLLSLDDIPTPPGNYEREILVNDGTATTWASLIFGDGINSGIHFPLHHYSYHDYVYQNHNSWWTAVSFMYDGSKGWTPEKFSVICSLKKSGSTGSARLYDYTNRNIIAELSWTNEYKEIASTTNLSNLPTTISIVELQLKTNWTGRDARLHYMALY